MAKYDYPFVILTEHLQNALSFALEDIGEESCYCNLFKEYLERLENEIPVVLVEPIFQIKNKREAENKYYEDSKEAIKRFKKELEDFIGVMK